MVLKDCLLWEDDDFLVIDKPSGISTLSDRKDSVHVLSVVKSRYPDASVAHRLDKDTSGVLVIAKHAEAYRFISIQFEERQVQKYYHAIVDGKPDYKDQVVDAPIEKLGDGSVRIGRRGKPSLTIFNTLEPFKKHTLVEARPVTGRTHQIRIHLSLLGTPITGDQTYGGKPFLLSEIKRGYKTGKAGEERPLMTRMALHAKKIEFQALNGHPVNCEAPYPKDFKALLNQLRQNIS